MFKFNTPTKATPFCQTIFTFIDGMCNAMRGLKSTDENRQLQEDLRKIKTVLNHEDDVQNITSLFQALNFLIEHHNNVIALIPIVVCIRNMLMIQDINAIYLTIHDLRSRNKNLNEAFNNFLSSTTNFKEPTQGEGKKIYDTFVSRLRNLSKKEPYRKASSSLPRKDQNDAQTEPGWERSQTSIHNAAPTERGWKQSQASTYNAALTEQGWEQSQVSAYDARLKHEVSLTQEELTIFGENIRYRLMALALELNEMPNDQELGQILGLNTTKTCLKDETQLIVRKVSRAGDEWQNLYQQNRLENILEALTNWFDSFSGSNRLINNNFKMIIINLIYDFLLKSHENFQKQQKEIPQLQKYIEDMKKTYSTLLQYGNTLLNEIKNNTEFEAVKIVSDGISNIFTQQKIYHLYSNILSRLSRPDKLVNDFDNVVKSHNKQEIASSENTPLISHEEEKCCSCCSIL
ncbi:MAG: hypothetical protein AMJ43_05245 [Coxiella sp. DG_40]|nr:MAG: hypothetical protein AMJ43_05245 [Coxiella sp. DG_40]